MLFRVELSLSGLELEGLEALAFELGAQSVLLSEPEGAPDESRFYETTSRESPLWDEVLVSVLFEAQSQAEALLRAYPQGWLSAFEPQDYLKLQEESRGGVEVGRISVVLPEVYQALSEEERRRALAISPCGAFGTGAHPSTALCLLALQSLDLQGKTLIDFGSGSGVLSFAALKLGAARAFGCEIDRTAREASLQNAQIMGLLNRFEVHAPEGFTPPPHPHVVVANIFLNVLLELKPALCSLFVRGARVFLSGVTTDQAKTLISAYQDLMPLRIQAEKEGWALLCSGTG